MPTVAFPGKPGAYSEYAIYQFFGPETKTISCESLEGVFEAVEQGQAEQGILPVENALSGTWSRAYELLMERDLRIGAEVILRIQHTLMATPGAKLADLKRVRSTQQTLDQCEKFLHRHNLSPEPAFDTAGSAQALAAHPEPELGVIASKLAADIYKLTVLEDEIEDASFNYTRFFIMGWDDPPRAQRSKTSLIFAPRNSNNAGALYQCLGEFAQRNINLTKIESRPRRDRPWQYLFYLDFEGHWQDPAAEAALLGLMRRAGYVKLLGSFPRATTPRPDDAAGVGAEALEGGIGT
jgi:prephenate dehydratase